MCSSGWLGQVWSFIKGYLVARRERASCSCSSCQKVALPVYRKLLKTAYKNRVGECWGEEGRKIGKGRRGGERVSAVFFLVHGDEWVSEQGRKYIISPLMGTHFCGHNSVFKNREGRVKYDIIYSSKRHFYEPSLQYKGIDCYFKALC